MSDTLWILSAWHRRMCETSVFLVNEECLEFAGIEEVTVDTVSKVYFGSDFSNVKVMKFEMLSDHLLDDLPLDMELRAI